MPYGFLKAPHSNKVWLMNKITHHLFSKKPIPLERAMRQERSIRLHSGEKT
jgi:hypothetical protein